MPETKVKERPILFSAPMVRALLEGHKTQTRRIVKPQPTDDMLNGVILSTDGDWYPWLEHTAVPCNDERWRCPYGQVGDRLWVKETYRLHFINGSEERGWDIGLEYRADDDGTGVFPPRTVHIDEKPKGGWPTLCKAGHNPWRSPRFMPRWASRILLEVTDIRVERVRDISEEDSMAEGVQSRKIVNDVRMGTQTVWGFGDDNDWAHTAAQAFLHDFAPDDSNPWVWALTFKRVS